jgi:hypothetical protein
LRKNKVMKHIKKQAEYVKAYRASEKALQQPKPLHLDIKTPAANTLQNAFRNKLARNEILKLKQDKAKSLTSQINQQRKAHTLTSFIIMIKHKF